MSRRSLIVALCSLAAMAGAPARAQTLDVVEVFNNYFQAQEISVEKGETVTWVVRAGGHSVTADAGEFEFYPEPRLLTSGETITWQAPDTDRYVYYHCRVHGHPGDGERRGTGMHGWIKVGDPPQPPPPPPPAPRVVPSAEYPSIRAALNQIEPGTVIEVRPGTYFYSDVTIDVPAITIRGTGDGPADTVIDGSPGRPTGIAVRADDVRIENLTVRGYNTGILFDGVDGFEVAGVHSLDNRADGILARASRGGVIRNARAAGGGRGIVVQHCDTCDTVIRDSSLSSNGAGIILEDAGSVIIRGSDVRDNGTGIVAMVAEPTGRSGLHIWGNTIVDNTGFASNPFIAVDEWNRLGVGVWMSGVSHSVVERNWIEGHAYAVAITAVGPPSVGHRVTSNTVDATIYGSLAWDGLGADVCFEGNVTIEAGEPSSEPPAIQALYPCSLPHTVGVPFPTVTARLHAP